MRSIILSLMLVGAASAAERGVPVYVSSDGIEDTLLENSFVCKSAMDLLNTKEVVLAKMAERDISEISKQLQTGNCDVYYAERDVTIRRVVRGYIIGTDGERTAEILLEIKEGEDVLGWTESVNLLDSAPLYEEAKRRMNEDLRR